MGFDLADHPAAVAPADLVRWLDHVRTTGLARRLRGRRRASAVGTHARVLAALTGTQPTLCSHLAARSSPAMPTGSIVAARRNSHVQPCPGWPGSHILRTPPIGVASSSEPALPAINCRATSWRSTFPAAHAATPPHPATSSSWRPPSTVGCLRHREPCVVATAVDRFATAAAARSARTACRRRALVVSLARDEDGMPRRSRTSTGEASHLPAVLARSSTATP